jgi:hypothetical protein
MHNINDIDDDVISQLLLNCGAKKIKKLYIGMHVPQLLLTNNNNNNMMENGQQDSTSSFEHDDGNDDGDDELFRLKFHCPQKHQLEEFKVYASLLEFIHMHDIYT